MNRHLLTLMLLQTCMSFFLVLNIKEDILKNAGNQIVNGPHSLAWYFFPYKCLVLQNIFICVQHKK